MKIQLSLLVAAILLCSCAPQLPLSYTRKSLNEKVFADNHSKRYTLHTDQKPNKIIIENRNGKELRSFNNPDSVIHYKIAGERPFFTIYGSDTLLIANRNISFKKVVNFRDIGGLPTTEGKIVRWGKIFRSDNLSTLKEKEFKKFSNLQIATVYDLRTASEIATKQDNLPDHVKYVPFAIINDNGDLLAKMKGRVINGEVTEQESREMMFDLYRTSITDNILLKELILKIIRSDEPLLYHCSAGKDRTGIVTALLLSILKVDRETIIQEYMLSNFYRNKKVSSMLRKAAIAKVIKPHLQTKVIKNFMSVDRDYIDAVFNIIDVKYGGIDNYIINHLDITDTERSLIISKFTY